MLKSNWLRTLYGELTAGWTGRPRGRATRRLGAMSTIEPLEARALLSVDSFVKISDQGNGGPDLEMFDEFGEAVALIGDVDGDGVDDVAVAASNNGLTEFFQGMVHVLFMNADGTVKSATRIADSVNGGPDLAVEDFFGKSITSLGDVDGDAIPDIAVGAPGDDTGGTDRGAVYIVRLNANGTAKSFTKIAHETNGGPTLANGDQFGRSVVAIGDVNGDAVIDLAVGAAGDDTGAQNAGAVYILRLNADETVGSSSKLASGVNGGPVLAASNGFGTAVASLGDVDGDAVNDLAVGAPKDANGGDERGTAYILLMNADETVKSATKIVSGATNSPVLANEVHFGVSIAAGGDLNADGIEDLVVGASEDSTGGLWRGAVHLIFLNQNGSVKGNLKLTSGQHGAPTLADTDNFGSSVATIGDLNNDGNIDLLVGAETDGSNRSTGGAAYVLFLDGLGEPGNTDPSISLNDEPVQFVKGAAPLAFVPNVTLTDNDASPAFQIPGGQLILSVNVVAANKKGTKRFDNLNTSSLNSVGNVGSPQVVNGRSQITVNLSDSATLTQIRDALRAVTFSTNKKGLKIAERNIQIQVIDKAGGASNVVTQTILVRKKAPSS